MNKQFPVPFSSAPGGSGSSITLKTNGVANGSQSVLNLVSGSNTTLTDNASGSVTIAGSPAIITDGLIAEYRMTEGSGTTLTDFSGNGNAATFPGGSNNPAWLSGTGGLSFVTASTQYVPLPAAVNAAKTMLFVTAMPTIPTQNFYAIVASTVSPNTLFYQKFTNVNTNYPQISFYTSGGSAGLSYPAVPLGTHIISYTLGGSADKLYFDNFPAITAVSASAVASSGVYRLGGGNAAGPGGSRATNSFTGSIYYAAFYNRELTASECAQNYAAVLQMMQNRTLSIVPTFAGPGDSVLIEGDSIPGLIPNTMFNLNSRLSAFNIAIAGSTVETTQTRQSTSLFPGLPTAGSGTLVLWVGTNDQAGSAATTYQYLEAYCRYARDLGWKALPVTMMSRTSADTFKNNYNTLIRSNWRSFADGLIDIASDPNLGADGASANTTYFSAGLHPTAFSGNNACGPILQRGINRFFGNTDFSTAATYTSGAPAATAVTACSESGNTVTYTFASNPFSRGKLVTFTGITPAEYNGTFQALTSTATQITCYNSNTGLGVGTVFGTATTPLQADEDQYVILGGSSGSQNFTLQTAIGFTGQNLYLKNTNSNAWTVTPFGSETIDGGASVSVAAGATLILQSVLVSAASAGANWIIVKNG